MVASTAAERHRVIRYEIMLRIRLMRENRDLDSAQRWWTVEVGALAREAIRLSVEYSGDVMERARLMQKRLNGLADHAGAACGPNG